MKSPPIPSPCAKMSELDKRGVAYTVTIRPANPASPFIEGADVLSHNSDWLRIREQDAPCDMWLRWEHLAEVTINEL